MTQSETLRRQAAELRRLARVTADQSDAFVYVLRAIELEATAEEVDPDDLPATGSATAPPQDCDPI